MAKTKSLTTLKQELSVLAERVAREEFGRNLDYSVESVRHVEEVLAQLHQHYATTHEKEGLRGLALEFAAYLIGVIERNFGAGTWRRDHEHLGPETFPYEWRGADLFPYGWCLKRILDGPQDDVWAKFQTLVVSRADEGAA
jgi:hypothetical protein